MNFEEGITGTTGGVLSKAFAASTVYVRRRPVFLNAAQQGPYAHLYGYANPTIKPNDQKEAKLYFQPFYDLINQQKGAQNFHEDLMKNFGRFQKDQMDMVSQMVEGFNQTLLAMNETMQKMVSNFETLPQEQEFLFSKEAESRAINAPHVKEKKSEAVITDNTIMVHQDPNSGKLVRMGRGEKAA